MFVVKSLPNVLASPNFPKTFVDKVYSKQYKKNKVLLFKILKEKPSCRTNLYTTSDTS